MNGRTPHVLQQNTQGFGLGVTPIGPTWNFSHYFLGADDQGRDVFARLLYGGRNSLLIGATSALICCFVAAVLGVTAGYFGGPIDWVLSRMFDIVWAFPIYLLAISLSVVLLTSGLQVGPFHIGAGSLLLPILIIASVYVPYVARPLRGIVISLKRTRVHPIGHRLGRVGPADPGQGDPAQRRAEHHRVPAAHGGVQHADRVGALLPRRSASSPPAASWGTIINDGLGLLYTRPGGRPGARDHDRDHGDLAQHPRRRCPRRVRPQGQTAGIDLDGPASSFVDFLSAVLVMFTISVLVFLIFFATPGVDPAARIAGRSASPQVLAAGAPRRSASTALCRSATC